MFLKNCIIWAAAIAFLSLVWVVAYYAVGNDLLVPSFSDCLKRLFVLLGTRVFWTAFFATLLRVLIAFVLSFVLAVVLAVVSYLLPTFKAFFAPIVSVLRSLPTLAVLLVLLVWTGANGAPVVVAFLSLFPMLYAGVAAALSGVDNALVEMSRVYKVPLKKRILQLYLPSIAPQVLQEAGAATSFALKLVVSAEVLAATWKSLGGMLQEAKLYLDMPLLFALVCVSFLTGLLLELALSAVARAVERRVK